MKPGDIYTIREGGTQREFRILTKEEVIRCTSQEFYKAGTWGVFVREYKSNKPYGLIKCFSKDILNKEGFKIEEKHESE